MPKILTQAQEGQRVRVNTPKGIKEGTVQEVDETFFPFGKVIVQTDDGETVEVLVGLGHI